MASLSIELQGYESVLMKPSPKDRTQTDAMNCFTGSVMHVLRERWNTDIPESRLLELGEGYLFEAGFDEYNFPEIKFESVPGCGKALAKLGYQLVELRLATKDGCLEQLRNSIQSLGQVIVWVNSEFLSYASVYFKRPGHLHSIVLQDIGTVKTDCFDPLIFDRTQYSCFGALENHFLLKALYTRVPNNDIAAVLGRFFAIEWSGIVIKEPLARDLLYEQAQLYFDLPKHRGAISDYARRCNDFFAKSPQEAAFAARRLFDHIRVLYIIPSLGQMQKSMAAGEFPQTCFVWLDQVLTTWKAMAIMALKYQATLEPFILERLRAAFLTVDAQTDAMWREVLRHGG